MAAYTHTENSKQTHITGTHLSHSRVTSPAALFMTTLDDMAPEEQVVHNVIPLKDKMPLLGFSDVHRKAKSSLTVTFVRCQSDASQTDVQLFYCRTAEDTTATHSVSERDHAGNVDFILLCFQVLVPLKRAGLQLPKHRSPNAF